MAASKRLLTNVTFAEISLCAGRVIAIMRRNLRETLVTRIRIFQEKIMSVAKVTEISSTSSKSFEDAINSGLDRANNTIDQIEGAWVKDMKVRVKDGKVKEYRVNMKLTFVLR